MTSTSSDPTDSPQPAVSEAEQRLSARLGAVLFRHRGWLPVPFLLVPLLAHGTIDAMSWIVGLAFVAFGDAMRLCGVADSGPVTCRRSRTCIRLFTFRVFAWMHHLLSFLYFLLSIAYSVL